MAFCHGNCIHNFHTNSFDSALDQPNNSIGCLSLQKVECADQYTTMVVLCMYEKVIIYHLSSWIFIKKHVFYLLASQFVGYVTAVIDAQAENLRIPVGATEDQVCAIVGKYLEAHPEEWNKVGSDLVIKTLRIAFSQMQ